MSSYVIETRVNIDGAQLFDVTNTYTDVGTLGYDGAIPTATTDQLVTMAFATANLTVLIIESDQDIRVCTNAVHSGSPTNTFNIKANKPFIWIAGSGVTDPVTGDVTVGLYITNATLLTANVKVRVLEHVSAD